MISHSSCLFANSDQAMSESPTESSTQSNDLSLYEVSHESFTPTETQSFVEPTTTTTSLPIPAPTRPAESPNSNSSDAVEASNTDSGVSSFTSDCPMQTNASRSINSNTTEPHPPSENSVAAVEKEQVLLGQGKMGVLESDVRGIEDNGGDSHSTSSTAERLKELSDIKTGGETSSESDSRSSSSMGYLEPRPLLLEATHPREIQQSLLDKMQTLTTKESSPGASSVDSSNSQSSGGQAGVVRRHSLNATHKGKHTKNLSLGAMFKRKRLSFVSDAEHTTQAMVAAGSTTALILQDRPKNLPAKSPAEERRHQKLYEQMVAAARKKELQKARDEIRKEKQKRQKDKEVNDNLKEWARILPNWEAQHKTRKVQELWWHGLPPGVRGEVWRKAIGNDLNISPELYRIFLGRCKERLASMEERRRSDSNASQKSLSREHSVEVIHLDVIRTFPTLGFFQEGGPYNSSLHDVLGAYACYRPDVGYVQGMSFLAAVLLLNMEAAEAFICLANLLNRPSYLSFFRVDYASMKPYFDAFNFFLQEAIPKLSVHFTQMDFSPEYYLIEWVFTIYTRALPLDLACRVWDLFCRDDESSLFRTALGILRLYQSKLLELSTIEDVGGFLGRLPGDIDAGILFQNISAITLSSGHFAQIVLQHQQQQQQHTT